ncbi:MAG TPA: aminotransferase class III-fold pyridoxal phosphate-dependent enzyme [bacterium]|nr:aminotransferase class III-fold pyridoxal phosphate-dependent enzyme [bacterium]
MNKFLNEIYSMDRKKMEKCEKHLMLGGGTKGIPVMQRGKGVMVFDMDGKPYIDCTSQSWALYLGHANGEMNAVLTEHLQNMSHMHQGVHTPVRYYLAKLLAEIAPDLLNRVSFTVGGGPAIEAAMKICIKNTDTSRDFICLYDSYHGTTLGSLGATWMSTRSAGKLIGGSRFLSLTRPFVRVPNPNCYRCFLGLKRPSCGIACAKMLEMTLQKGVAGNAAGFILEPIQASGGQVILPAEYLKEVRRICNEYSVPLVFDEIQTYCRIGEFFAAQYFGVSPDIIVLGKGLGGGLPLAAIIISDKLKGFEQDGEELHTFANNSLSQVAAIKLIRMMQNGILENTRKMGAYLRKGIESLQKEYPQIGDIRQAGLHIGIEFVRDPLTLEPAVEETGRIRKEMIARGVIPGVAGPCKQVLKIKPPLIINQAECDQVLNVLSDSLRIVFGI